MKIKNTPKNGLKLSIFIAILMLIIFLITSIIPNQSEEVIGGFVFKEKTPIWKIVCYIISAILFIFYFVINLFQNFK